MRCDPVFQVMGTTSRLGSDTSESEFATWNFGGQHAMGTWWIYDRPRQFWVDFQLFFNENRRAQYSLSLYHFSFILRLSIVTTVDSPRRLLLLRNVAFPPDPGDECTLYSRFLSIRTPTLFPQDQACPIASPSLPTPDDKPRNAAALKPVVRIFADHPAISQRPSRIGPQCIRSKNRRIPHINLAFWYHAAFPNHPTPSPAQTHQEPGPKTPPACYANQKTPKALTCLFDPFRTRSWTRRRIQIHSSPYQPQSSPMLCRILHTLPPIEVLRQSRLL